MPRATQVWLRSRSNVSDCRGVQAHLLVERRRGWLGFSLELHPQDRLNGVIVSQRLGSLTPTHVAAHHEPVRVLATGIMGQQLQRIRETRREVAAAERRVR